MTRFFRIESVDAKVLADPAAHIIDPGGQVFFAINEAGVALGTCALKPAGDRGMELTKMAVSETAQGRGIGRQIMQAVLAFWRRDGQGLLFLESHSSLAPALRLYESVGFVLMPRPYESEYARSDVYMEWSDPGQPG
ncbi:MAG: GNAT family N-acetyltransferase [Woeseiaceae bacterium]